MNPTFQAHAAFECYLGITRRATIFRVPLTVQLSNAGTVGHCVYVTLPPSRTVELMRSLVAWRIKCRCEVSARDLSDGSIVWRLLPVTKLSTT